MAKSKEQSEPVPLGASDIRVSPVGIGAWAWGDFYWGSAPTDDFRAAFKTTLDGGITFLDTADNGTSNLFTSLNNTGNTYNNRVRGMVAMLMTLQRFNEQ